MHWLAIYALGVGTAAVAKAAGPALGRALRPAARSVIKQGLIVGHEVQRLTEEASASLGDLTAEARQEVESRDRRPSVHAVDLEPDR
jgi:Protein of unknown function (DUF5132)